jgi:hypothetical protein
MYVIYLVHEIEFAIAIGECVWLGNIRAYKLYTDRPSECEWIVPGTLDLME